jgi:hypothetical protein
VKTCTLKSTGKVQLASCSCQRFTQFGSACKHLYYINHTHNIPVVERAVLPLPSNNASNPFLPTAQRPTCLEGEHIDLTNVNTNETSGSNQDDDLEIEIIKLILPTGKTINTYQPPQRSKCHSNQSPSADHPAPKKPRTTNIEAKQTSCKCPVASSTMTGWTLLPSGSFHSPQKSDSTI